MQISRLLVALVIAIGVGVYFLLRTNDDPVARSPTPVTSTNPWVIGPIINGINYSQAIAMQPSSDGGGWYFDFPQAAPGVHYVTRSATQLGRSTMTMRFRIEGTAFKEVDAGGSEPGPAKVRLFIQRRADDWGGANTGKQSYRFWSLPLELTPGEHSLQSTFSPQGWVNVNGQQDSRGFAAILADLDKVGFTFGGMFAGHGAYAVGPARFHIREFTLN